jgi:hypothetical protein
MPNNSKCPHCGETRPDADFDWLSYHEDGCHIIQLEQKLKACEGKLQACEKIALDWATGTMSSNEAAIALTLAVGREPPK